MEVFSEFYEGDKHDMRQSDRLVSNSIIQADVDINAKEFDLDVLGATADFDLPNMDFGTNSESYNVEDMV